MKARERSRNLRIRTPRGETNNARVKLQGRDGESKKTRPTLQRPGCRNPDTMFSENLIQAMKFLSPTTAANEKTQKNCSLLKYQHLNWVSWRFPKKCPYEKKKMIFQCQNGFNQEFQINHKVCCTLLSKFIQVILSNIKFHIRNWALFWSRSYEKST